jgi:CubicO group peptidase (beta-lactamase class C family)
MSTLHKMYALYLLAHPENSDNQFFNEGIRDWCANNVPFDASFWKSFKQPLVAQPGEDWNYGASIDWAGAVLEKVTGMTLGEYCQKNIFEPLGVKHIAFGRVSRGPS